MSVLQSLKYSIIKRKDKTHSNGGRLDSVGQNRRRRNTDNRNKDLNKEKMYCVKSYLAIEETDTAFGD